MIPDSPAARSPDTALRDLLRRLERNTVGSKPARPSAPPTARQEPSQGPATASPVRVGDWELTEDPDTGDLIATHAHTGATRIVARKAGF